MKSFSKTLSASEAAQPKDANTAVQNPKRTGRGKKVLALAIGILWGLMGVEILVRLSGLDLPRVWEPDPVVGWRHIPGATRHFTEEGDGWISVNSLGFRDRERTLDNSSHAFRIVALGDSMTEADQVNFDQTYCCQLEQHLNSPDRQVDVLNFGVNGYSPINELLLLKREGPRYRPDLVMLELFLDNDVSGCHPVLSTVPESPFATLYNDQLKFDFSRSELWYEQYHREPVYTIRKCSATFRWLRNIKRRHDPTDASSIPTRHMLYADPCPPVWDEAWAVLEHALVELNAEAKRQGAPLLIISFPCAQCVDERAWASVHQRFPAMKSKKWDLERPERRLRDFADRHGLLLFQPADIFRTVSKDETLYFSDVGHINARGHQLMAQSIAKFINDQQLLVKADRHEITQR